MNTEIWTRLVEGRSLDDLDLPRRNGRLDLSELFLPEPTIARTMRTAIADVTQLAGIVKIRDAKLQSLDFSGSRLNHLLFFNCVIDDCVFDNCACQDWGLWGNTVTNTTFRSADLRKSALGAVENGRRNSFRQVDFTKADLRGTMYTAAEFIDCTFKDTRLDKVDFNSSTFVRCKFEGELREVQFYRKGFKGEAFPPNEMTDVDFTHAKLRWSEFRGLDMETVKFPEDNDHVAVSDYSVIIERLIREFSGEPNIGSRKLANYFEIDRKWIGAKQRRGVFNKNDLFEMGGEEGLKRVLEVIEETHATK